MRTYLVHLEGRWDRLNQDRSADGSPLHANVVLSHVEDIVPQAGLEVRFHLRQIEVWASPPLYELFGIVEKVQPEVKQAA